MKFDDRTYPDIVRDLLTTLTGGTVAETIVIPPEGVDRIDLNQRPVRRVSHLQGKILVGEELSDYRFTERDFELVGTDERPDEFAAIRFRDHGRQPAPGTTLTVNYYPIRTMPTPINDVNVGSVARTMLETVAREMAVQYSQLQKVYESGFVETAKGTGLDKVVALVDVKRLKRGHPVGKVRFSRRSGSSGSIYLPPNTVISDGESARYFTSLEAVLMPNQSNVEVWVYGQSKSTPTVDTGALSVMERAIAGVDRVTNDEPTFHSTEDEQDDQLSSRARRAIHGTGKGTLDAIRFGLESLPFVSAVALGEYTGLPDSPVDMPGKLRVDVAMGEDNAYKRSLVKKTIKELRPAGIFVDLNWAEGLEVGFIANLCLAGSSQPSSEVVDIKNNITQKLSDYIKNLGPGSKMRRSRVSSIILQDERIVDLELTIKADNQSVSEGTYVLPPNRTAKGAEPLVQFGPDTYEETADVSQYSIIQVDAQFTVEEPALSVDEIEILLKPKLETLLDSINSGQSMTFQQVLNTLRDTEPDERYVVVPAESVVSLEEENGTFTNLVAGESYSLGQNTNMVLRSFDVSIKEEQT